MSAPKAFEANMAATGSMRNLLANPLAVATKPPVIFKFASTVISIIIYSCISHAWFQKKCLFNGYSGICRFGSLSLVSFIICATLFTLEILFSQFSSIKIRRRIAIADVILSAAQAIFYLLLFIFLLMAWLKSPYPPFGYSINACRIAIMLSFLAIFCLAASTGLAYLRYQSGVDSSQFMTEEQIKQEQFYVQNENVDSNIGADSSIGGTQW